jgi:hypothetical protein
MRCARSWTLQQRWRDAWKDQPDGISPAAAAAFEAYRHHLATCQVCQDQIHYLQSIVEFNIVQEELMGEKLQGILKTLIERSTASGKPERAELQRGLRVDVRVLPDQVTLLVSRAGVQYPSDLEWGVITRHWWPSPLFVDYERVERGGRCYLRACWNAQGIPVQLSIIPEEVHA